MNPQGIVLVMVGDELLDGRTAETNSHWLIDRATEHRWSVERVEVVGDDVDAIAGILHRYVGVCAAILVSGGLGPTPDDLTRDALAKVSGEELILDAQQVRRLEKLFHSRGREMPKSNERQAERTPSSHVLDNPVGTAPGLWQDLSETAVVLLPGVPLELHAIFEREVAPRLSARIESMAPATLRLRTTQISESALASKVEEAVGAKAARQIAFCVSRFGVDLLLRESGNLDLDTTAETLRSALAGHVFGEGRDELNEVVVRQLTRAGRTLAVAESCTGGLVAGAITEVPGSSAVLLGGVVAYANEVKQGQLGVSPALLESEGAVSEAVAQAMAEGARTRFGSDFAISTTGIAGPGGGTPDKPVGLVWVALAGPQGTVTRELRYGGDRGLVRRWTVAAALDLLRRAVADGR